MFNIGDTVYVINVDQNSGYILPFVVDDEKLAKIHARTESTTYSKVVYTKEMEEELLRSVDKYFLE